MVFMSSDGFTCWFPSFKPLLQNLQNFPWFCELGDFGELRSESDLLAVWSSIQALSTWHCFSLAWMMDLYAAHFFWSLLINEWLFTFWREFRILPFLSLLWNWDFGVWRLRLHWINYTRLNASKWATKPEWSPHSIPNPHSLIKKVKGNILNFGLCGCSL